VIAAWKFITRRICRNNHRASSDCSVLIKELKRQANRILIPTANITAAGIISFVPILHEKAIFIAIPAVLMVNYLIHRTITRIPCPKCQQPYGMRPKKYRWLHVPEVCQACGEKPD
jgi:predicted RNA-binding Zn-ribbon protein involved in translation (DUF1610 family)